MKSGLPARIGRYEVVDRLGAGGMGVVYLATDPLLRRPDHLVEPTRSAVQVIGRLVDRELMVAAVQGEAAAGDAVREAPDDGAEVGRLRQVALEVVVAEDDVAEAPLTIGYAQRHEDAAVGEGADLDAAPVGERVDVHLGAVGPAAEERARQSELFHDGNP